MRTARHRQPLRLSFSLAAPASDSSLVRRLARAGPPTTLALSHIRHATRGALTLANTQPFVRELAGRRHAFAHNGDLPGLTEDPHLALAHFQPQGETDSEHAFCALLARLAPLWQPGRAPTLQARLDVVAAFAAALRPYGPANFLYADGDLLFAHGHRRLQPDGRIAPPGLHWLQRRCAPADAGLQAAGLSVAGGDEQVLLLASVPLSDEPWQALAEGETVAVRAGALLARRLPR